MLIMMNVGKINEIKGMYEMQHKKSVMFQFILYSKLVLIIARLSLLPINL